MRSPIQAMIDAACACVKCGAKGSPGSCGCWVRLTCPKCRKVRLVDRDETDPPDAATVVVMCPPCNPGDFDTPTYFDRLGREVFWKNEA